MSQNLQKIMMICCGMKDFISYIDWLKYKQMLNNPDDYFSKKKKVMNFDIIHHECRGDPLKQSYKEHKTQRNNYFMVFVLVNMLWFFY